MLNKRSRLILLEIIKKKYVSIRDLAKKMHVSQRTIRLDLQDIEYFLKVKKIAPLVYDSKGGIRIDYDNKVFNVLYELINQQDIVTSSYSPEDRMLELLYYISMSLIPLKIDDLADQLLVSKSTVVKDLEKIKSIYHTEMFSIQGTFEGMIIVGDELKIRQTIINNYIHSMDKDAVVDIAKFLYDDKHKIVYRVYWRLFESSYIPFITECVEIIKNSLIIQLSDIQFIQTVAHLSMMFKRIAMGRQITVSNPLYDTSIVDSVVDILHQKFRSYFNQDILETEKQYLRYIIYSISYDLYIIDHQNIVNDIENDVNDIIKIMKDKLKISDESDPVMYDGLIKELKLIKVHQILGIASPKNIITLNNQMYKDIYQQLEKTVKEINRSDLQRLNPDELWRIAYYFIDAYQRERQNKKQRIIIVSDKSQEVISILKNRLYSLFNIEIVAASYPLQAQGIIKRIEFDYVISTLDIGFEGYKVLRIHPLLSDDNIMFLKAYLSTHTQKTNQYNKFSYVEPWQLIDQSMVRINTTHELVEDIIKDIYSSLYSSGCILEQYGQLLLHNLRKMNDYTFLNDGVVFINVRIHELTKKTAIILLKNKKPVMINRSGVKADIFMVMVTKDNSQHYKVAAQVLKTLRNNADVLKIRNSTDINTIRDILKGENNEYSN